MLIFFCVMSVFAQNKRYLNEIYPTYQLQSNITYGLGSKNIMDIYTGTGDIQQNRPLVIFIHGGGFKDGDKVSNFGTRVCGGFAKRGYVVASINYRTTSTQNTDQQSFEAMIRALQDSKAAVRYFRKNAGVYGIDSTQIFATGSSAGCITALHMAYLDQNELPSYVTDPLLKNLEGASGNPGPSSKIQGVISNWGAIGDTAWIKKGDVPVYCVHGTADSTVYYTAIPSDGPFRYSSKYIYEAANRANISSGLRVFNNTGHTLDNSSTKQDSAIRDFSNWLYTILKKTTAVNVSEKVAEALLLHQNYPNPFNPVTDIKFEIPNSSIVNLVVYDVLGRRVSDLVRDEFMSGGIYQRTFDAKNLSSGIYFCRLTAGRIAVTKKMILVK